MMQEFVQRLTEMAEGAVNSIHTAIPGTIESFDSGTCQATVKPSMMYKKPNGETIGYPSISGVPVYFPNGNMQDASISWPVKPGDGCLLIIAEQALDYWMYGRETDTDLHFDLTNSIAIPGLFVNPGAAVKRAQTEDAVVIIVGSTQVAISEDKVDVIGDVAIKGNVTVQGSITVTGGDVVADGISLKNHRHGGVTSGGSQTSTPA